MGLARKYIVSINDTMSYGLGTYTNENNTCSLLNEFILTSSTTNTTCMYNSITVDDLKSLSVPDYNKRVEDFLQYINIEDSNNKDFLIGTSVIIDPSCLGYDCYLNQNFLIYKFFNGVRIIDVGDSNGVIEYKLFPNGDDEANYNWQSSATFLDLDENLVYVVKIRDYISTEDYVVCEYEKLVSISWLQSSTKGTLPPKLISLKETSSNCVENTVYKIGCIDFGTSPLSIGQKVGITYCTKTSSIDNACSCVKIQCLPNGCTSFVDLCTYTNTNGQSPRCGIVVVCYGDTIKYEVSATENDIGLASTAELKLLDVNGFNTIIPTIDITNNVSCAVSQTTSETVYVGLSRTGQTLTSNTCTVNGVIAINPSISLGQSICACVITTNSNVGGTTNFTYSKSCEGGIYVPFTPTNEGCGIYSMNINAGELVSYSIVATAPTAGTCSSGSLSLYNLSSTTGVIPIICSQCSTDSVSISSSPVPIIISLCKTNTCDGYSYGYINPDTLIPSSSCIMTTLCYTLTTPSASGGSSIRVSCKPNGSLSYVTLFNINTICGPLAGNQVITMRSCDSICYTLYASGSPTNATAEVKLLSATSTSNIIPSISTTLYCDYISN